MIRRAARVPLLLAALGIAAAGIAAVIILPRLPRGTPADLDALLARLDAALAGGATGTAREELLSLARVPGDADAAARVLRRAADLASATDDWEPLRRAAGLALSSHPRDGRLRAAAAWAALRTGRVAEARRVLARGPVAAPAVDLLRSEAALAGGEPLSGADGLTRALLALEGTRDPAAFVSASLQSGDARLALDAALLMMARGESDAAASLVQSRLTDPRWDEPAALILWDAGRAASALERLQRMAAMRVRPADVLALLADVAWSLGDAAGAESALRDAVAAAPSLSWTTWADLALLSQARGDLEGAAGWIAGGRRAFPSSRELGLREARLAAARGDEAAARASLERLLAHDPASTAAARLLLDLEAPGLTLEAYRARLWKIFNRDPGDPALFDAMVAALAASGDWEGGLLAVDQHEAAAGPSADSSTVRGALRAMDGDWDGALAAFRAASGARADGVALLDAAVVLVARGSASAALASIDAASAAQARLPPASRLPRFDARAEQLRGEAFLLMGRTASARTALRRALALDPRGLRAALLLRKLEAPGQ